MSNPFARSILGAAFHTPTIHRQLALLHGREVMLRLALAARLSGNSDVVKRVAIKLQPRIVPEFLPTVGLVLASSRAHLVVELALQEMDLNGGWPK